MVKKKENEMWKVLTYMFGIVVVVLFVTLVYAMQGSSSESSTIGEGMERELIQGNPDAEVTVVEYSDLECPFCARFYDGAYQQLKEEYIDTGKIKFVYKHFPLEQIHPNAMDAALAMECAADQGQGFELHNKIFEGGTPSVTNLKIWAGELGLDTQEFESCLDSRKYEEKVMADLQEGKNRGVSGTPTVFVGDEKIVGAQPFNAYKQAIDQQLSN